MYFHLLFIVTFVASVTSLVTFQQRNNLKYRYRANISKRLPAFVTSQPYKLHPRKLIKGSTPHEHKQPPSKSALFASEKDLDNLISSLLNNTPTKNKSTESDEYSQYTHQIAIPLSTSSELTSALHSIQTSLVRDCPRLVRACVMPATLRLPLLYVDATSSAQGNSAGGSGIFSSTSEVDRTIEHVVHTAIQTVVYNRDPEDFDGIGKLELPEPIMLPFRGLELQGADNSVLYAVGYNVNDPKKTELDMDEDGVIIVDDWGEKKESGYERLQVLVKTIQTELEKRGYKTAWPSDEPQGNEVFPGEDATLKALRAKQKKWRPRVPFVRLPTDFYDGLDVEDMQENEGKDGISMDEIDAFFSKGFDGISPTFWYEAWGEEDILPSPGVRMKSVQVFRRMISGGGEAEGNFYGLPYSSTNDDVNRMDLPDGDVKQMEKEQKATVKELERMGEIESEAEREWEAGKARMLESQVAQNTVDAEYADGDYTEFDVSMETGDVVVDGDAAYSYSWAESGVGTSENEIVPNDEKKQESTMQESIKTKEGSAVEHSSQQVQTSIASTPERKLPRIEDNPIFQRLWKGEAQINAQGESTAQSLDGTSASVEEELPPYPSDEHFVGIWKVVQSPLGVSLESESSSQSSDNLVLRVDGQVMGGPILDAKYQQKAAGGSWKMFQAFRRPDKDDEESEAPITRTRLRIKLLIPPEKEQVLVMEGEVTRVGFGGKAPTSSSAFTSAGGMLDGMSTAKLLKDNETTNSDTDEQVLYCGGEAWIENVDESGKRRKIGPFSLTKQRMVDRNKFIYTVPATRGGPAQDDDSK
jgi:hypothetical protein